MREARKGPCVTNPPVVRDAPVRDIPHYGEIEYGPLEGYDVMEPDRKGGQVNDVISKKEGRPAAETNFIGTDSGIEVAWE